MEDIVQEILLRLPEESLARCKLLSKYWQNFISHNQSFRRSYLSRNNDKASTSALMMGFFLTKPYGFHAAPVRFLPTSVEGRSLQLKKRKRDDANYGGGHNAKPFLTPADALPSTYVDDESLGFLGCPTGIVNLLGSSNGFLFASLERDLPKSYSICDPINKRSLALPIPTEHTTITSNFVCHGFFCTRAYSCLHYYKVVRVIGKPGDCGYSSNMTLEILSSDLPNEWMLFNLTAPVPYRLMHGMHTVIISEQGVVYFRILSESCKDGGLLIFDQTRSTSELQLMELPPAIDKKENCRRFGQSDGLILYAMYELDQIKVWVLNDKPDNSSSSSNNNREWSLKYTVVLDPTVKNYSELIRYGREFCIACFHPEDPRILFLASGGRQFLYYMDESRLDLACDLNLRGCGVGYFPLPYTYGLIGQDLEPVWQRAYKCLLTFEKTKSKKHVWQ